MITTREAALEAALQAIADLSNKSGNEFKRLHPLLNGMLDKRPQEHWYDAISEFAAEALSTPATEPQGYVVKPLVWEQRGQVHPQFKAVSVLGTYYIERNKAGLFDWWSPWQHGKIEVRTLELAKAAAQADHEARILSAIIGNATPVPSDKIAEAARLVARSVDDDMAFFNKVALSFDLSPDMPVKHFFAHALMHFADAHEAKAKALQEGKPDAG